MVGCMKGLMRPIKKSVVILIKIILKVKPTYRILGACNPQFAHKAMELEPQIGALLPCNVVVREESGKTRVEIMDPRAVLQLVERPEIEGIATEVRTRLARVLASL